MPGHSTPEIMWAGKYITAKREGPWEYVSRSRGIRAAVILAVDESGGDGPHLILVEQFRVPLGRACLELPAGLVGDEAGSEDEHASQAAIRELEEETGYRAAHMRDLGEYYSSPGLVSESFTLFRADGLTRTGDGGGHEGENITVHRAPLADIHGFLATRRADGLAIDVKLLVALGAEFLR
ncbi:NUDIX hydrolase [Sphingobium sp. DEHP117]|uniref:NUDIX hydrolase n=1 Tax=Sphingobium sp. DEHP117 TaxID=2993436 RepID=UPI0027D4CC4C|nr:NUDIX domain-containing protein [Sphingobium sp. DEHP117]MDQ4419102.1 NUDIX hydrolase [Sphingobium sp. DEHP117]